MVRGEIQASNERTTEGRKEEWKRERKEGAREKKKKDRYAGRKGGMDLKVTKMRKKNGGREKENRGKEENR